MDSTEDRGQRIAGHADRHDASQPQSSRRRCRLRASASGDSSRSLQRQPKGVDVSGQSRVDVVVLDLGLPGFDGLVVSEEIAAHPSTSHIPIVVVTGSENPVPGVRPDCVLRKPVAPERVVVTVAKCLRESRSERT